MLKYLQITDQCLPYILKLQHLEDLVLEGCFGLDDSSLEVLRYGCKSLKYFALKSKQIRCVYVEMTISMESRGKKQCKLGMGFGSDLSKEMGFGYDLRTEGYKIVRILAADDAIDGPIIMLFDSDRDDDIDG
ncbi:hypothetical protein L484_002806 [Morus notabilis]|uniref:Uncharacterized protein n=1 Tax=Morus notabilis TaxID=981085 RepID=W9RUZ0_9ROSA|nr:hypothetical protein L484_002806 [Morus notabilis]